MNEMTSQQKTEEIIKLLKEYEELTGQPVDLDRLINQLASEVSPKPCP